MRKYKINLTLLGKKKKTGRIMDKWMRGWMAINKSYRGMINWSIDTSNIKSCSKREDRKIRVYPIKKNNLLVNQQILLLYLQNIFRIQPVFPPPSPPCWFRSWSSFLWIIAISFQLLFWPCSRTLLVSSKQGDLDKTWFLD